MNRFKVVDTNVLIAANGRSEQANVECVLACVDELQEIRAQRLLVLDAGGELLAEYAGYCSYRGQPGVGDEFFRWAFYNRYMLCELVELVLHEDRGYEQFPDSEALLTFDLSDRKFVATALACNPAALVVNAVDSDWSEYAEGLRASGVEVEELCPDCIRHRS